MEGEGDTFLPYRQLTAGVKYSTGKVTQFPVTGSRNSAQLKVFRSDLTRLSHVQ